LLPKAHRSRNRRLSRRITGLSPAEAAYWLNNEHEEQPILARRCWSSSHSVSGKHGTKTRHLYARSAQTASPDALAFEEVERKVKFSASSTRPVRSRASSSKMNCDG